MKFIDRVQIHVASGKGGAGCVSFRREAFVPRGGPDGGNGGRGGSVILKVNRQMASFLPYTYKKKFKAENGQPGASHKSSGKHGADLILEVPEGTVIYDTTTHQALADLGGTPEHVLLEGGRGGKGNCFYKSSVNQAPSIAQRGEEGQKLNLTLELKSMADVGLVGLPNAGKSSFVSRVSAARPKVAEYPFTTLVPHLGVVSLRDEGRSFVVADIPGIIEGAHKGVGLGIRFLRHIERTKVFIHLVDMKPTDETLPWENYDIIVNELKKYDALRSEQEAAGDQYFTYQKPLMERPQLVALTKADILTEEEAKAIASDFQKHTGVEPFVISSVSGKNIDSFIFKIGEMLDKEAETDLDSDFSDREDSSGEQ